MSNRSTNYHHQSNNTNNHTSNSNFRGGKTHKKFVPKNSNFTPQNPNPNPNFSTTLRQSDPSKQATIVGNSGSRIRLGDNGKWVSSKTLNGGGGRGNFVIYLPQEEAVASGLGGFDAVESQRVVDLLNRELVSLLLSKPRDFWKQVASDASLHEFLDSYLQFRSRWYDFPYHGAKGTVAGVIVGDLELSRRVFMVLYRISSNKDPGALAANSLSQKDHEALLQEKKLLDLPKLLDICAVYGHENEDLTRSLVLNAINAQPLIYGSFTTMISHFLGIVQTMYQRCISSLEALISAGGSKDHASSKQEVEFLEVMDFLNDAAVSMDAFVRAYRPAAIFFSCPVDTSHGNEELINVLATLHDSLLPSLQQGLQIMLASGKNTCSIMLSDVSSSLRILGARIVDLGWKLVDNCYLSEDLFKDSFPFPAAMKMYPASVEDPVVRADILVQTFKEISAVPQHAQGNHYRGTFLQNMEKKHQVMLRIQSLQTSGWIQIEDEQYQYLITMMPPMISAAKNLPGVPTAVGNGLQKEEDAVIMESRISQVKDIFPDYGKGFISACLEVYDHNPEEVIQRILEGTLHEDLRSLDTSIETVLPKSTAPPKKDKGKGILEGPTVPSANSSSVHPKPWPEPITSSSSSSPPSMPSSVGRFVRKSGNDQDNKGTLDSRDDKHMEKTAALLSQYEYEDEYDDSFDDLGMTVVESGVEETEILSERIKSNLNISSRSETQGSGSSAANSKWGSRKKPQFYVKDGKNYSYKVDGAIAVADEQQASLVTQAQKETIHGLGRGGNLPLGAVKKLEENEVEEEESDPSEVDGGSSGGRGRGRGRGRRGGGRNHFRKNQAMKKHIAGVGGF